MEETACLQNLPPCPFALMGKRTHVSWFPCSALGLHSVPPLCSRDPVLIQSCVPGSAGPGAGVGLIYLEEEEGRVEALVKTKKADEEQGSTRGWETSPFFLGRSAPPLWGWASGLPSWALGVVL